MKRLHLVLLCSSLLPVFSLAATTPPSPVLVEVAQIQEEDLDLAALAPDGKQLAYVIDKKVQRRKSPLSAGSDDYYFASEVWVTGFEEKPKRILKANFLRGRRGEYFSFRVERLAWSPDGQKLLVEITDEDKNAAIFLLTPQGKRVKLGSSRVNVLPGYGAAWLGDGQSLGILAEAMSPRLLHKVSLVRVTAGRGIPLFGEKTFGAVAWLPRAKKAVMVERDPEFSRPPRLVVGDLETGRLQPLDDLGNSYQGGLRASPDETRVSYFVGQEKLAVRGLEPDAPVEHWPVPFGRYEWAGTRDAVFFLEPEEPGRRTGWLRLYDRAQDKKLAVLPDVVIQDFWVSRDGQRVAVLTVGLSPKLIVYRLAPDVAGH